MSTRAQLFTRALRILDTNSTSYPQTDFNSDLNESLSLRTMEILRLKGYKQVTQTHSYTDLVSSDGLVAGDNGFNGEYSLPTDLLDIDRVEVTFDGTTWCVIDKNGLYDISQNPTSEQNATSINNNFSKSDPKITIIRGSMFIRPLTDTTVSNGIHVFYSPRQSEMDEDTDVPDFEGNLHQCLIYDCAEMEMLSHPDSYGTLKERRIAKKKFQLDNEFKQFYRTRLKGGEDISVKKESFK
jgi:hypothetical protein